MRRLSIKGRTAPSQPTLHRISKQLDAVAVESALSKWAANVLGALAPLEGAALDGKALRGALKQGALSAYLLSAVSHRLSTVLAQVAVSVRTNESGRWTNCSKP